MADRDQYRGVRAFNIRGTILLSKDLQNIYVDVREKTEFGRDYAEFEDHLRLSLTSTIRVPPKTRGIKRFCSAFFRSSTVGAKNRWGEACGAAQLYLLFCPQFPRLSRLVFLPGPQPVNSGYRCSPSQPIDIRSLGRLDQSNRAFGPIGEYSPASRSR